MDPSFRIRGHELRSDSFLGRRLGWRQRNEEIVKRGNRPRGTTLRKQKIIARSSADAELCSSIGSVRSEGGPTHDVRLGFCSESEYWSFYAKTTEHILHRHAIGKMKHIDVAHL